MSSPRVAVDRAVVDRSFREWQEEQELLDAQLAESVAALDAYQAHLDNWQQELVREREELRQLRAAIERDRSAGVGREQIEHLNQAVEEAAAASHGEPVNIGPAKVEPRRTSSPVLGSVLEQFGKLREQRSLNRSNNKPR
jgi:septal ring factor EnvC (AmiA/AmiB activator)